MFDVQKSRAKPFPRPWISDDKRPSCTLVLGDGFTQDFLHHFGLQSTIPSRISSHFPAAHDVPYLPRRDDMFGPGKLWEETKWPKVVAEWQALGKPDAQYEFYQQCAKQPINPHVAHGAWTFYTDSMAYELRAYLWHFFISFQHRLNEYLNGPGPKTTPIWPWKKLILALHTTFKLSIVTFNYDMIFSNMFCRYFQIYTPVEQLPMPWCQFPMGSVFQIKVHGGIDQFLHNPSMLRTQGANPWLSGIHFDGNVSNDTETHPR